MGLRFVFQFVRAAVFQIFEDFFIVFKVTCIAIWFRMCTFKKHSKELRLCGHSFFPIAWTCTVIILKFNA